MKYNLSFRGEAPAPYLVLSGMYMVYISVNICLFTTNTSSIWVGVSVTYQVLTGCVPDTYQVQTCCIRVANSLTMYLILF